MKAIRLKDVVETIGIISIVASLIFLAIQVKQAREVALSETTSAMRENGLQLESLVVEHADVWWRGSAGELLPEPEARPAGTDRRSPNRRPLRAPGPYRARHGRARSLPWW